MKKETLRIGTRGSQLALWQAEFVRDELTRRHRPLNIELKIIKTTGDKILDAPLSKIGDKGLFTREIERALLDNEIDLAVHSLKDLPTSVPDGLAIAAITKREMANDVLISDRWKSIDDLSEGATVATGSLRRTSQLLHLRPDLRIVDIRGNLNTRFKKFDESKWDAMILAYAGVKRLGWEKRIAQIIPLEVMLPAVGQGALGIEIREDDAQTSRRIRVLHHRETAACTKAERSLLRALEGGCQIPIGAFACVKNDRIQLSAIVGNLDGTLLIDAQGSSVLSGAEALGKRVARKLLKHGAEEILQEIRAGG